MTDPVSTQAADTPDALALVDAATDETLTFAEYDDTVEDVAARLTHLDVGEDDRVAVLAETHPVVAHVFFACWRLGAIVVPLNARLATTELQHQMDAVDPTLVLATPDLAAGATQSAGARPVYSLAGNHPDVPSFAAQPRAEAQHATPVTKSGDDADPVGAAPTGNEVGSDVAYLFTSGTTGEPKAVRLTTGNFHAAARAHRDRLGVDPDERWLCPLSTYHMGGLAIIARSAIYGTTAVLQRTGGGFDPTGTRRALDTYECTAVSVVPVMLRRLLDDGPLPDSLRFVLTGGAPTPRQLVERATDRDVPVCPSYGMTETTSQAATPTPAEAAAHPDTVGRPLPGVDVTLVDEDDTPVERGTLGEIVVDGATVTPGYLHGGGEFGEHGFHTGDVARMDADGRLTVLNRREDRILTGGENVHPGEVTAVLTDHPGVTDAAVLGIPDPEWGERVATLVVPAQESAIDADAIQAFARGRLAGYKVPRTVVLVDDLPRTASGTVDRQAARDLLRRVTDT